MVQAGSSLVDALNVCLSTTGLRSGTLTESSFNRCAESNEAIKRHFRHLSFFQLKRLFWCRYEGHVKSNYHEHHPKRVASKHGAKRPRADKTNRHHHCQRCCRPCCQRHRRAGQQSLSALAWSACGRTRYVNQTSGRLAKRSLLLTQHWRAADMSCWAVEVQQPVA